MKLDFFARTLLRCAKKGRQHLSLADRAQLFLNYDVLHIILTEHMDKYKDILNFILANKLYFRLFYATLIRHNVRHGGCSALPWAAQRRNMVLVTAILNTPRMEELAPLDIWSETLKITNQTRNMTLAELLFQVNVVRASIDKAAHMTRERLPLSVQMDSLPPHEKSLLEPMFSAAKSGEQRLVKLYLSHGIDVNLYRSVRDGGRVNSVTLLDEAIHSGNLKLIKLLIEEYRSETSGRRLPSPYQCPIVIAAGTGNLRCVERLLLQGADPRSGGDPHYSEALALAASHDHVQVVELLLRDNRINPNLPSDQGCTPLCEAVQSGSLRMIRLLLDCNRVDPNQTDKSHNTPLLYAAASERQDSAAVIHILLSDERVDPSSVNQRDKGAMYLAISSGNVDNFKALLHSGRVDPNQLHGNWRITPAMHAAEGTRPTDTEILKLLVADERVDLNTMNKRFSTTALTSAADCCALDNVQVLLSSGRVQLSQGDDIGKKILKDACLELNPAVVKLLVDMNSVDLTSIRYCIRILDETPQYLERIHAGTPRQMAWESPEGQERLGEIVQLLESAVRRGAVVESGASSLVEEGVAGGVARV